MRLMTVTAVHASIKAARQTANNDQVLQRSCAGCAVCCGCWPLDSRSVSGGRTDSAAGCWQQCVPLLRAPPAKSEEEGHTQQERGPEKSSDLLPVHVESYLALTRLIKRSNHFRPAFRDRPSYWGGCLPWHALLSTSGNNTPLVCELSFICSFTIQQPDDRALVLLRSTSTSA